MLVDRPRPLVVRVREDRREPIVPEEGGGCKSDSKYALECGLDVIAFVLLGESDLTRDERIDFLFTCYWEAQVPCAIVLAKQPP